MENPIKMGDFGGTTIFGNIHMLFDLFWSYTPLFPIEFHRNVTWPHHEASKFDKTTPLDFTQFQVGESLYFQPIAWPRHIHKDYRKKRRCHWFIIQIFGHWLTCQYIWICIVGCQNPVTVWRWSKLWPHLPMYFSVIYRGQYGANNSIYNAILVSWRLKICEDPFFW